MTIYYEDLTVGEIYKTDSYTITKEEIITFAEQFDPQPFHVDEAAAQESMFGEIIASGLHTLCLTVRLYTTDIFQGEESVALMGGWGMDELRFDEPVYPGDTLYVQMEITDKNLSESRTDRGYVDFYPRVFVGDREVMSVIAHGIVRRNNDFE
ncbi:MaoC/PaaZ C-terminal domain-containing protein [Salinibaculum salinum]|uniref:MaoC/PaaZ C-terminal domain-containing protein n=1 Tax=Salinibaculum salinum TaxID=3131996 RepID=UPI0030EB1A68